MTDLFKQDKHSFQQKRYRLKFQVIICNHSLNPIKPKLLPNMALSKDEIWWLFSSHFILLAGGYLFSATPLSDPRFGHLDFCLCCSSSVPFWRDCLLFPKTPFAPAWDALQQRKQLVQSILAWLRNPYRWAKLSRAETRSTGVLKKM